MMAKLHGQFVADVQNCLEEITRAAADRRADALEHYSHTLASVCGTFGAQTLEAAARRIEAACLDGDTELARSHVLPIRALGARTLAGFECLVAPAPTEASRVQG